MPLTFTGLFDTDDAYEKARQQFTAVDRPVEEIDRQWDLYPNQSLEAALLTKLANVPQTTVNVIGATKGKPTGSTSLYAKPANSEEQTDLTMVSAENARQWITGNADARYLIRVEIYTGKSTRFPGTIVEILNHELSAHAEPFADYLTAELAIANSGVWESVEVQHDRLGQGDPRYMLIGARYMTTYLEADQAPRYQVRRQQDTIAKSILPPQVPWVKLPL
jgi:hypothetical protein